jgi:predicted transcriptional regulator
MYMKNRSRDEILMEILSGLDEPESRTAIMYKSRLSYAQLQFYHKYLLEKKLIREEDRRWVSTDKGKAFLKASMAASQILNDEGTSSPS